VREEEEEEEEGQENLLFFRLASLQATSTCLTMVSWVHHDWIVNIYVPFVSAWIHRENRPWDSKDMHFSGGTNGFGFAGSDRRDVTGWVSFFFFFFFFFSGIVVVGDGERSIKKERKRYKRVGMEGGKWRP